MDNWNQLEKRYIEDNALSDMKEKEIYIIKAFFALAKIMHEDVSSKPERVYYALPFRPEKIDVNVIKDAMASMDYMNHEIRVHNKTIHNVITPCLVTQKKRIYILTKDDNKFNLFDPLMGTISTLSLDVDFYFDGLEFYKVEENSVPLTYEYCKTNSIKWSEMLVLRFKNVIKHFTFITMLLHIFSLAIPIYIMFVYDKVINANNPNILMPLTFGILLIVFFDIVLKILRSNAVARISSRIDYIVNTCVLDKLMRIPIRIVESVPVVNQVARLKSFSVIREFVSSPTFLSCIEIPFVIIMIFVLAMINIYIIVVPIASFAILLVLSIVFLYITKSQIQRAASARTKNHQLLNEYTSNLHDIKYSGMGHYYLSQLDSTMLNNAYMDYKSDVLSGSADSIGRAISLFSALFILFFGVQLIWADMMSVGGLIAAVFLNWRILSPMQNILASSARLEKLSKTVKQIDEFMTYDLTTKHSEHKISLLEPIWEVKFCNVGLKKSHHNEIMFKGLSLSFKSNQLVTISGRNGSGKSALLKLLSKVTEPSVGKITVNKNNLKSIDDDSYKDQLVFIPQSPIMFSGNILEYFTRFNPGLSVDQIKTSLCKTGIMEFVDNLENGIQTNLQSLERNPNFNQLLYKLNLARPFLMDFKLLLIDHIPDRYITIGYVQELFKHIEERQTNSIVVCVTFNQAIIDMSNLHINLDNK